MRRDRTRTSPYQSPSKIHFVEGGSSSSEGEEWEEERNRKIPAGRMDNEGDVLMQGTTEQQEDVGQQQMPQADQAQADEDYWEEEVMPREGAGKIENESEREAEMRKKYESTGDLLEQERQVNMRLEEEVERRRREKMQMKEEKERGEALLRDELKKERIRRQIAEANMAQERLARQKEQEEASAAAAAAARELEDAKRNQERRQREESDGHEDRRTTSPSGRGGMRGGYEGYDVYPLRYGRSKREDYENDRVKKVQYDRPDYLGEDHDSFRRYLGRFRSWIRMYHLEDVSENMLKYQVHVGISGLEERERVSHLGSESSEFQNSSLEEYYDVLLRVFEPTCDLYLRVDEYEERKQGRDEDPAVYFMDKMRLFEQAYPEEKGRPRWIDALRKMVKGLYNPLLQDMMRFELLPGYNGTKTELLDRLSVLSSHLKESLANRSSKGASADGLSGISDKRRLRAMQTKEREEVAEMQVSEVSRQGPCPPSALEIEVRELRQQLASLSKVQESMAKTSSKVEAGKGQLTCFYCNLPGHFIRECMKKKRDRREGRPRSERVSEASSTECYYCHRRGHVIKDCKKRQADRKKVQSITQKLEETSFLDESPLPQGH